MSETNVSVRFSVQDAETVRQALEQLGTDGQKALDKLNAAGQAPAAGLKAISSVVEDLKSRATGLAFSLGPVGTGLVALGPVGLAAGAALGLVAAAIAHVIDEANRLGAVSQSLRNLSETTGLAGTALQGLVNAGGQLGIESEKVESSLSRFTSQLDQVHQAAGPLYDQILKVNPAIADQMVKTRDAATEWNLLARAYAAADTAQRAAIARAAFGRGGIGTGRLLEATAGAGGIDALAAQNTNVLTDQQITQFAALKSKIDETNKTAKDLMASIWTEEVLQRELKAAEAFERIAKAAKDLAEQQAGLSWLEKLMDNIARAEMAGAGVTYPTASVTVNPIGPGYGGTYGSPGADQSLRNTPAGMPDKQTAEATLSQLKQWMAILGPAATSTQTLNLKQAELNAAVEKAGGQYGALATRAMEYYRVQQSGSDLQIRIQNNVANADALYAQRQAELNLLVKQKKISQDEANQSLDTYSTKIVPEVIRQEELRKASLEGLKKLEQDAGNARLQLDTFATDSAKNIGAAFVDFETGAKNAGDAVKNLETQVIRSFANMITEMTIVKPLASGFQSLLGGAVKGLGSLFSFGFADGGIMTAGGPISIRQFADGGITNSPTLFSTSENFNPEAIVPLKNGSIPVTLSPSLSGSGGNSGMTTINMNVTVDVTGANGDAGVAQIAQVAAAQGVQQSLMALKNYDANLGKRLTEISIRGR